MPPLARRLLSKPFWNQRQSADEIRGLGPSPAQISLCRSWLSGSGAESYIPISLPAYSGKRTERHVSDLDPSVSSGDKTSMKQTRATARNPHPPARAAIRRAAWPRKVRAKSRPPAMPPTNGIRQAAARRKIYRLINNTALTSAQIPSWLRQAESSNENKMSDRTKVPFAFFIILNSSLRLAMRRSVVRSIAWLDLWCASFFVFATRCAHATPRTNQTRPLKTKTALPT
jgi:hypothetical protein